MKTPLLSYSEETIKLLIEKSMARLETLEQLMDEMQDDPKAYRLWFDVVEKLAGILERLFKIQNHTTPKEIVSGSVVNNSVVMISTAELLSDIQNKVFGKKNRESILLENE